MWRIYEEEIKALCEGEKSIAVLSEIAQFLSDALVLAQSSLSANGKEYEINRLVVKKILPSIPSGDFKLSGKEKIHAAGFGDMNDLLENPAFIGRLSEVL